MSPRQVCQPVKAFSYNNPAALTPVLSSLCQMHFTLLSCTILFVQNVFASHIGAGKHSLPPICSPICSRLNVLLCLETRGNDAVEATVIFLYRPPMYAQTCNHSPGRLVVHDFFGSIQEVIFRSPPPPLPK